MRTRATLPDCEERLAARTAIPATKTTLLGALMMTMGGAVYLFDQYAARKFHVFMVPGLILMVIGVALAVVGSMPDERED